MRCTLSTNNKRDIGSLFKQITTDEISQNILESYSPECTDSDQVSSQVSNIEKKASIHHSEKEKEKAYYPTSIQQTLTHWKMVTYQHKIQDNLLGMYLPKLPGLAPGMKARTKKEHTIQF